MRIRPLFATIWKNDFLPSWMDYGGWVMIHTDSWNVHLEVPQPVLIDQ